MQAEKPLSSWDPRSSVSFWINHASRNLMRVQDVSLRPFGYSMSQMRVLHALTDGASVSQKELARWCHVEQPTMAEMLGRMDRDGVVQREPNPNDGRGSLISLTRRSRLRWPKAKEALTEGEHGALAGFSAAEKEQLMNLLQRVVSNLEK